MTRKAARGRKTAARARTNTARGQARSATRTGRKTSSARASKTAAASRATSGKRATAPVTTRPAQAVESEAMHEPVPAAQHDDEEEMDWLGEDEDPRSQIVEDEEDWAPGGD